MDRVSSVDIDEPYDLEIARLIEQNDLLNC